MKKKYLALAISILVSTQAQAEVESPRMATVYGYEIGGSTLPSQFTRYNNAGALGLGVSWDMNIGCGTFDPKISVSNQLNGITDGFKSMMGNIVNSATSAVASLPALIIQRANPGLYDLLQQGVLQGKLDTDFAETSCEDMQKIMMGETGLPWEQAKAGTKQQVWAQSQSSSGGDAVKAKQAVDSANVGNDGRDWVCGQKRGGTGQQKVNTIYDVVVAGYNIYHQRTDICDNGSPTATQRQDSDLYKYWTTADAAGDWVTEVVGEVKLQTCEGCTKIETVPGLSLEVKHEKIANDIQTELESIVNGATQMTWQNLNRVSAPPTVVVTPALINSIRKRTPGGQTRLIEDISREIAYARLAEQSRLAIRMLRTGQKEPNVETFPNASEQVDKVVNVLRENMVLIKEAASDVKPISSNTINKVLIDEEDNMQNARPVFKPVTKTKDLEIK